MLSFWHDYAIALIIFLRIAELVETERSSTEVLHMECKDTGASISCRCLTVCCRCLTAVGPLFGCCAWSARTPARRLGRSIVLAAVVRPSFDTSAGRCFDVQGHRRVVPTLRILDRRWIVVVIWPLF
jgi:hypothetical protein